MKDAALYSQSNKAGELYKFKIIMHFEVYNVECVIVRLAIHVSMH